MESAPAPSRRWRAYGFGAVVVAAVIGVFYLECRQGQGQRTDAARALRCVLGPPPLPVAQLPARYRRVHRAARDRGLAHPQACRAVFAAAGRYHGNASSAPLQHTLTAIAELLALDERQLDDDRLLEKLAVAIELTRYDRR